MTEDTKRLADAAEMLWVVLANVSGGDWTKQTQEWQEAAIYWRDHYFTTLIDLGAPYIPVEPDMAPPDKRMERP